MALIFCANSAFSQISNLFGCPSAVDLNNGIVFTDPARKGELERRYRRLEGPYIGVSYVNGIIPDGTTVSYAGLFTYKHWRYGEVIQYEEPQTDLTALLKFETGSSHSYESVRYNPQNPERKWHLSAKYQIEEVEDFAIGNCTFNAVKISREGTLTLPDGKTKRDREDYIFVPELLLRVSGTGVRWGDISKVRKRTILDERKWPFSTDAADVLYP